MKRNWKTTKNHWTKNTQIRDLVIDKMNKKLNKTLKSRAEKHSQTIQNWTYKQYHSFRSAVKKAHWTKTKSHAEIKKIREQMSKKKVKFYNRGNFKYTGYFYSFKNHKKFGYRSSWELSAMKIFEQIDEIIKYEYETLSISYIDELGDKRITVPDFLVYYKSGQRQLIEVKPSFKIIKDLDHTKSKIKAMKSYAKKNKMTFRVLTEKELRP